MSDEAPGGAYPEFSVSRRELMRATLSITRPTVRQVFLCTILGELKLDESGSRDPRKVVVEKGMQISCEVSHC